MKKMEPLELQRAIKRYVAQLKRQPKVNGLITYLIFDPTQADPRHISSYGVPFYVGQGHFPARAASHFRGGSGRLTRKRFSEIYERGCHPLFLVVDHAPTHLASLYSELVWACHLVGLGYELTNDWAEHKKAQPPKTVPTRRLWSFSVEEAMTDQIGLEVRCRACGLQVDLPLDQVTWKDTSKIHLRDVRASFVCPDCSQPRCLRLIVPEVSLKAEPNYADLFRAQISDVLSGK